MRFVFRWELRIFVQKPLPWHSRFVNPREISWSSLNDDDVKTYSGADAISSSSALSAPLPTPTAYTVTPLFLIPCEATESLVYCPVVVCFPSVMTTAICIQQKTALSVNVKSDA